MKTTKSVLLFLLSGFLLSSKCYKEDPPMHCTLQLYNNTDKAVYVLLSYDYPDTSLNFQNPRVNPYTIHIGAHSKGWVKATPYLDCFDGHYDGRRPVEKVSVFVFDAALIDATPWNQVRQNYLVLKRFDLSKNDLINNNYTITLP
jgi:hypothetical protein